MGGAVRAPVRPAAATRARCSYQANQKHFAPRPPSDQATLPEQYPRLRAEIALRANATVSRMHTHMGSRLYVSLTSGRLAVMPRSRTAFLHQRMVVAAIAPTCDRRRHALMPVTAWSAGGARRQHNRRGVACW